MSTTTVRDNSEKRGGRHSFRLKGYDYSQTGAYFITACTKARIPYFDMYSELRNIVQAEWQSLPERFPNIATDAFVVMPNHVHAIVTLRARPTIAGTRPALTLGAVVGAYKSLCVNRWLRHIRQIASNTTGAIWQRSYYERIVRNEEELNLVMEYILLNPLKWSFDIDNPNRINNREYSENWAWLEGR
ncbi:MAG: transposase [Chloroflexi bacterium]|nr:transposase [Chloroflexota bacterium]